MLSRWPLVAALALSGCATAPPPYPCPARAPATTKADAGKGHAQRKPVTTWPAPRLDEARRLEVWVLGAHGRRWGRRGTVERLQVQVAPRRGGCAPVSIGERYPGCVGPTYRASVWRAAVAAANLAGRSVNDYCVAVKGEVFTDGPSAGAAMTAAFLAAMLRAPVRKDIAITGAVGPFATAAPVGGLLGKLEGVINGSVRRFALPGVHLRSRSPAVKLLRKHAASLSVELVAIDTLADAYHALTGRSIPAPHAVGKRHSWALTADEIAAASKLLRRLLASKAPPAKTWPATWVRHIADATARAKASRERALELEKNKQVFEALAPAAQYYGHTQSLVHLAKALGDKRSTSALQQLALRELRHGLSGKIREIVHHAVMTAGAMLKTARAVTSVITAHPLKLKLRLAQEGKPKADKLFAALVAYRGAVERVGLRRPLYDALGELFMIRHEQLAHAAEATVMEAETGRLAARVGRRKTTASKRASTLPAAALAMRYYQYSAREHQAAWPFLMLMANARISLDHDRRRPGWPPSLRERLRPVHMKSARALVQRLALATWLSAEALPLDARLAYQRAERARSKGDAARALLHYHRAIVSCRLLLLLAAKQQGREHPAFKPSPGEVPTVTFD